MVTRVRLLLALVEGRETAFFFPPKAAMERSLTMHRDVQLAGLPDPSVASLLSLAAACPLPEARRFL